MVSSWPFPDAHWGPRYSSSVFRRIPLLSFQPCRNAIAMPSFSFSSLISTPRASPTQQFPGLLPLASYTATLQLRPPAQKLSDAQVSTQSPKLYTNASESVDALEMLSNGDSRSQYCMNLRSGASEPDSVRSFARVEM